jgi:uncharacterized protein (DUF305 family)
MKTSEPRAASVALVALITASCLGGPAQSGPAANGPRIVQPGAPGQGSRQYDAGELAEVEGVSFTDADVHFMQGMIPHHAQALEMTALVRRYAGSNGVRQMGLRMEISQRDEIGLMEQWLRDHGQSTRMDGMHMMPGMLSTEQMQDLRDARGAEFDRLFLTYMIQHHQGALVMVDELFGTSGAGQESTVFRFAADVDADQTMEIDRMQRLLDQGGN